MPPTRDAIRILVLAALLALQFSAPAQVFLGPGTPGSGGFIPFLTCRKPYAGDSTFSMDLRFGAGGASGFLILSPAAGFTLAGGYPVYFDIPSAFLPPIPFVLSGPSGAPGAGTFSLPLPLNGLTGSGFAGLGVAFQAGIYDPAGFAVSNGLWGTVQMEPAIAIASSVAGNADPFMLIDPASQAPWFQGLSAETNNVNGVAFTDNGRALYVLSNGNSIYKMDMTAPATPVWTLVATVVNAIGVSEGNLQFDRANNLLWFAADLGAGFEMNALDVDPSSPTLDQIVYSTNNLGTNLVGTWALSPSGRRLCVPDLLGGSIRVWDTDPASPAFLMNVDLWQAPIPFPVVASTIPTSASSPLWLNTSVAFSEDEDAIFILRQAAGPLPGEIAVYSFSGLGWLDFDPSTAAIDNIGTLSIPPVILGSAPTSLSVGPETNSLFVSGFGGAGWAGRIDNPLFQGPLAYAPAAGFDLTNAWRSEINPNKDLVAIASGAPFSLRILDLQSLAVIGTVPLNMNDATNVVWH